MNVPAVKTNIHKLAILMLPSRIPMNMPRAARIDDTMLYVRAWRTDIPARSSTAKSPVRVRMTVKRQLRTPVNILPNYEWMNEYVYFTWDLCDKHTCYFIKLNYNTTIFVSDNQPARAYISRHKWMCRGSREIMFEYAKTDAGGCRRV